MKSLRISTTLLLVLIGTPGYAATVNFGSLIAPLNITNSPSYLDGFTFNYEMSQQFPDPSTGNLVSPAMCVWDGTYGFGLGVGGDCIGGQIDGSGIYGTTDGTYIVTLELPSTYFSMKYMIATALPPEEEFEPEDVEEMGVDALFMNSLAGTVSGLLSSDLPSGSLAFQGPSFDTIYLNFRPSTTVTEGQEMDAEFGEATMNVYDVTTTIPEPGSLVLMGLGLLGLSGLKLRRRK